MSSEPHQPVARTVLDGPDAVRAAEGTHLGHSPWVTIDQARIDLFADATDDHQWIHVDPKRAADGPFGATIAHGYLTLSLSNYLLPQVVEVSGFSMGLNYGLGAVRYPAPVPVGSRVRAGVELAAVTDIDGGVQTEMKITMELEGSPKPACVLTALSRYIL